MDNKPKLTLSGKKNIKKLKNRMTKHMEAYPETKYGFVVKFNDDAPNKLFIVRPCRENEDSNITIKWIDYMIIEKLIDEVNESTNLKLIEALWYPTTVDE